LEEFGPEAVLVCLRTDGGTAFVARVACFDVLGRETEVVETCFRCDLDPVGPCLAEHGYRFDGGEMHDVELQFRGEMGEREDFGNGVGFEGWGP